jgi:glutathione S-transferase
MRKLLYSGSAFARRVRVVLLEKGLDFEPDFHDGFRPVDAIRPHNPALQVPVLYDGDRHLFGSGLILHYLFQEYPDNPTDPADPPLAPTITRADRHWDDMLILTTIDAMADAIMGARIHLLAGTAEAPYAVRQRIRIDSCLDWLEDRIAPDGFWPEVFSVMDLNLMCALLWGEARGVMEFRTGQWPKIVAMSDRWQSRPSMLATALLATALTARPASGSPPAGGHA